MLKWVGLMAGGAVGTAARYGLSEAMHRWMGTGFPFGTLTVNMLGCLLGGFAATMIEARFAVSHEVRLMVMAGFLGAFTTFSTYILESSNLLKDGRWVWASINIFISIAAGLAFFKFGEKLANLL
ncbi:MAG: fluoride efflux transporter CrcB [Candidatus Omnitrophica bacterium]|nr:fluoride efflux transporter CrcB [Candidatus Omnitrophota bacterium]